MTGKFSDPNTYRLLTRFVHNMNFTQIGINIKKMKFNLDKEIEQAVNFYAKDGEREMLEAAIRGLIEKATKSKTCNLGDGSIKSIILKDFEDNKHMMPMICGSGKHIYP